MKTAAIEWRRDAAGEPHHFAPGGLWSACRLLSRSLTVAGSPRAAAPLCPVCTGAICPRAPEVEDARS